jgi:hypothetical protein
VRAVHLILQFTTSFVTIGKHFLEGSTSTVVLVNSKTFCKLNNFFSTKRTQEFIGWLIAIPFIEKWLIATTALVGVMVSSLYYPTAACLVSSSEEVHL